MTICVENTTSEMGSPTYLRSFVERNASLGIALQFRHRSCASRGWRCRESRGGEASNLLRELVASAHIHDNHGERDEHLPPYEGTIDWPAAVKLFTSAPGANLPLVLELKEKIGPEALSTQQQLDAARKSLDRLEKAWG